SFILFLRKKEKPKEAYYTLEVKHDGSIRQWYGAYDRKPDKEKIEKVLERFTKKIQSKEKKLQAAAAAEQEAAEQGLIMAAV
ncbi:MAG: PcfJ domain-containing protein, partial [Lachnospiraceae bacterium]|nr:PcfJ domain-containing protein [Lachnospiraceae bacterium]